MESMLRAKHGLLLLSRCCYLGWPDWAAADALTQGHQTHFVGVVTLYTVLNLHLALCRQPQGCYGLRCQWVWHPCSNVSYHPTYSAGPKYRLSSGSGGRRESSRLGSLRSGACFWPCIALMTESRFESSSFDLIPQETVDSLWHYQPSWAAWQWNNKHNCFIGKAASARMLATLHQTVLKAKENSTGNKSAVQHYADLVAPREKPWPWSCKTWNLV